MAGKNDTHRWENRDGKWVYLAPGESEPQAHVTQRIEQVPAAYEAPKSESSDKK